ncbi:MAG: type I restriction endonuclease subunit R [Pseudomonadota bacterium]
MSSFESVVEEAAIAWLGDLGWHHIPGPVLAPDGDAPERDSYRTVILEGRLRRALARINDHLPPATLDEVARAVLRLDSPSLEERNHAFHKMVREGVAVKVRKDGRERGDLAWLFDHEDPDRNDWLVVSQLTVVEGNNKRRPDLVLYVNGLPLAVVEFKNPEDPNATIEGAHNQLQLYKDQIPALFSTNEVLVVSDGTEARVGSLTAGFERFGPWRTIDGVGLAPAALPRLQVLLHGLFERRRFLDYLYHFVLWETDDGFVKKTAGYHQFHAVNKAVDATVRASSESGDQRIGVVWHTQGSGKSISMVYFAGKVILHPEMQNPTLVVVTDRNDLDGQLFAQFCAAKDLVPNPKQAESREHLRALLDVVSGGVVFTTIQKFSLTEQERTLRDAFPALSRRRNIVVIVDEAHRTQYGFETRIDATTGQVTAGLAQNLRNALPNASFIGFTGTPIEFDDRSTPAVFGDYIDTYTIRQSVEDGATVPIFYEARLARINLPDDEKPKVDEAFDEVTEAEEEPTRQKLKTTWARLEALVGTPRRLHLVAEDILDHWGRRLEILDGKAMIVCMSRRICVDLYNEITRLRPDWHSPDDEGGSIKVVMTGSGADPVEFHPHVRGKDRQKAIEKRFKDPADPLRVVIVRDMWLTGFDVPCAHTLYVDKPMQGHGLLQAIARVNRRFKDKPSGLVVDYLGLAEQLRKAIASYGGEQGDKPGVPVETALLVLREKFEVVRDLFHGFDYTGYFSPKATERLAALAGGVNHVCGLDPGDPDRAKKRYIEAMTALNKAAGIALHLEGARHLRDEVGFFQAVQGNIQKYTVGGSGKSDAELNAAIRQIVSGAVTSEGVIDVFGAAGIQKPDLSVLSDEFLETVKKSEHKNLQLELLKKLLADEIRVQSGRNVVVARKFSEMLERTLIRYQNRTLSAAQVILELIEMAKQLRDAPRRGVALGLTEDELAFYDALVDHAGVREVMGDAVLATIAHDLVEAIRGSVTIDWTQKEAVRADMRRKVKRLLRKHGYPPDKQAKAVVVVIQQAERVCRDWARMA